jgi:AraC-like DNA-binding protein
MSALIYEQVFMADNSSFHYRRYRQYYMDEFPYHQHPEFEITMVISGNGNRVTDDFVEPFREGEIVIVPPNIPHGWVYDKSLCAADGMKENACWQFRTDYFDRLAQFAPEFSVMIDFYRNLNRCIVVTDSTAGHIRSLLLNFQSLTEPESAMTLLKTLYAVYRNGNYRFVGEKEFHGMKIHKNQKRLQTIYKYVVENYNRKITLDEIASVAAMSKTAFCIFFKKVRNQPFASYLTDFRLQMACSMLVRTDKNISEISFATGFGDVPYFNRIFKKKYGMSPSRFRLSGRSGLPQLITCK